MKGDHRILQSLRGGWIKSYRETTKILRPPPSPPANPKPPFSPPPPAIEKERALMLSLVVSGWAWSLWQCTGTVSAGIGGTFTYIIRLEPINSITTCSRLTLYTLTSVCLFSILFSIHINKYWRGEFVLKSGTFVGDHFLYSRDLNVWFKDDIFRGS